MSFFMYPRTYPTTAVAKFIGGLFFAVWASGSGRACVVMTLSFDRQTAVLLIKGA